MSVLDIYAEEFAAAAPSLPGAEVDWLDAHRHASFRAFLDNGVPTPRLESWKYTNLRGLGEAALPPAPCDNDGIDAATLAPFVLDGIDCRVLVFVNGRLRADLSDDGQVSDAVAVSLAAALRRGDPDLSAMIGPASTTPEDALRSLNGAFMMDGAVIRVAPDSRPERPLHLLFLTAPQDTATASYTCNLIIAGRDSAATIIETHAALGHGSPAEGSGAEGSAGEGSYWTNATTRIVLESGAQLRHHRLQDESLAAYHLAATSVDIAADAHYESFAAALGAKLSRHEIEACLSGEGARCDLRGIYLGRDKQHLDNTTQIVHSAPGGHSRQVYRGVLDDHARGVFQGKVVVAQDAQRTDAHQLNQNLLLSESAEVNSKPELEINADDVKCSHGATTGALDEEALFYLRSRGIAHREASHMLTEAFVVELVVAATIPAFGDWLRGRLAAWLAGAPPDRSIP